jgi:hypothetical protein
MATNLSAPAQRAQRPPLQSPTTRHRRPAATLAVEGPRPTLRRLPLEVPQAPLEGAALSLNVPMDGSRWAVLGVEPPSTADRGGVSAPATVMAIRIRRVRACRCRRWVSYRTDLVTQEVHAEGSELSFPMQLPGHLLRSRPDQALGSEALPAQADGQTGHPTALDGGAPLQETPP